MMNQEWYCTSTVIAKTTIVLTTSTCDLLKAHIRYFIKVAVTLLSCTTICRQTLDKVVTFAGEVLLERKNPTSIKPDATLGERIDLRISGQPEVTNREDEKAENLSYFQLDKSKILQTNR